MKTTLLSELKALVNNTDAKALKVDGCFNNVESITKEQIMNIFTENESICDYCKEKYYCSGKMDKYCFLDFLDSVCIKTPTILEKLLARYPNTKASEQGIPEICPSMLGMHDVENDADCTGNCAICWNQLSGGQRWVVGILII